MFHPNLTQISQQLHMLPYPDGYEVRGLEPLSVRPYSFTMVLSNSLVNRIVTLRVDYDGMMPKFIVIQVNKKPCEEFELMSDFARVFEVSVKTVPVPVVEEIVEVHSVHVMNQQKDLLKNRLKVMLEGLYHPTTIEITHNDGISTEGYFVAFDTGKYIVQGFKLGFNGRLDILDFKTRKVVNSHEAATLLSGYSPEARAIAAALEERVAEDVAAQVAEAAEKAKPMSDKEKRRAYSKGYYERSKKKD
jgi:hypothetical protein